MHRASGTVRARLGSSRSIEEECVNGESLARAERGRSAKEGSAGSFRITLSARAAREAHSSLRRGVARGTKCDDLGE